jgi:hypothetical protein
MCKYKYLIYVSRAKEEMKKSRGLLNETSLPIFTPIINKITNTGKKLFEIIESIFNGQYCFASLPFGYMLPDFNIQIVYKYIINKHQYGLA